MNTALRTALAVTSRSWSTAPRRPRMANEEDHREGLSIDSQALRRGGEAWIPVSGEIHYSRVPRARWEERIRQIAAGGITVVACYVPWIHHVPAQGDARFDGNLDVAAFIDLVRAAGLEVVVRIGPWAHGELRNGGYPDWVQDAAVDHRTDDPAYLDLVREWWGQLAAALDGRITPENILGIQLENELYDQPEHIRTLKGIARDVGFSAPFWTATAWGGAQLPDPEVFPLFGGYGDGFWVDADAPWDPSFRDHFFFSHVWDDPGIGADLRADTATTRAGLSASFPPATCEVGGGMATAYHRRPLLTADDIAAVAHCKLGNGSAWQGFYMYVGGTNPAPGLQESHATGYPNDMPPLSYDFHAPIGEAGLLAPSHAALRRHAAFITAFGHLLGEMPSHLPDVRPVDIHDAETLRWAFRGDDDSGFLFVSWHQPFVPLDTYRGARFEVDFAERRVTVASEPLDIPAGTRAQWPVGIVVGEVRVEWATASAVTLLPGSGDAVPTLVLLEDAGIAAEIAVDGAVHALTAGSPTRLETREGGRLDVLLLAAADADAIWVAGTDGPRELLLSADELQWSDDADGTRRFVVRSAAGAPAVSRYDARLGRFVALEIAGIGDAEIPAAQGAAEPVALVTTRTRDARGVATSYGSVDGRASAPSDTVIEESAARYEITLPATFDAADTWLHLEWIGDVGRLLVDGSVVSDRFWDGTAWSVNAADAGIRPGSTLTLQILPLATNAAVHLPADAAEALAREAGPVASLVGVTLEQRPVRRLA